MQSDSLHVCERPFLTLLVVLSTVILKLSFLPAGQPPVLKLLMCPILRFFAPQGGRDSRINVKFGTVEGISAVPNFTLLGDIWGFLVPKTRKFAKKIPVLQTFSPHRGESLARF